MIAASLVAIVCPQAGALDLVDRARIPEFRREQGKPVYVASLAPLRYSLPLFQIIPASGSGGGSSSITSGTTTITGGGDTQICFNDGGFISCGDAGFTFNKTTDTLAGPSILSFTSTAALKVTAGNTFISYNEGTGLLTLGAAGLITQAPAGVRLNATSTNQQVVSKTVALTEAGGAETVITITTTTTQTFGLELSYRVRASDATPDYAVREGSLKLACINNATVVTCTKDATAETDDESVLINTSAKTLTYAIAVDVATASVAKITFNIDSDMTVNSATITWTAILNGSGTVS